MLRADWCVLRVFAGLPLGRDQRWARELREVRLFCACRIGFFTLRARLVAFCAVLLAILLFDVSYAANAECAH
jgi:hypothetical protein